MMPAMVRAWIWAASMLAVGWPGVGLGQPPSLPSGVAFAQVRDDVPGPDLEVRRAPPAPPATLAILILSGEEAGVPLSELYGSARKVVEAQTALVVAPLDTIALADREAAIRDCAGKAECFAARARVGGGNAGVLLTVSVDRHDDGLLLGFRLVDVKTGQQIGASADEVPMGMSLAGAMEQQLRDVFPGSIWGQVADVRIETEPSHAEVTIGSRSCASPCRLTRLPPGVYEVSARKAGYDAWRGSVELVAKEEAELAVTLEAPAGGLTSSPLFWSAVGLAAATAGVAAFFLLRPADRVVNICIAPDRALCD